MNVTGYLALYTTVLGWQQYQNLWDLMTGTGLVYLPFIGIILRCTVEPFLSMGAKDFSIIAVRRLIVHILSALFVIAICCVPSISLNPKVLHFEPTCQSQAREATPGDTGTTYDDAFNVPTSVKIPLVWYLVMAVSNGFTHAANVGLSCAPVNYRQLHTQLNTATIQSPTLKQETIDFYQECYVPAYSKLMNGHLSQSQISRIKAQLKQYGDSDVGWIGSQIFLTEPGFYDAIQASTPVEGFPFNPSRDQIEGQVQNHSQWGEPYCNDWWSDASSGLHTKLMKQFQPSFIQSLLHIGSDAPQLENEAIRQLIQHNINFSGYNDSTRGYASLNDDDSGLSNVVINHILMPGGVALQSAGGFTSIHLIINALPVIQAAVLFCLYTFLAIAIPFSGYKPSFIVTASIVLFAVIFCSYIWHLVAWFDNHLIEAVFGNDKFYGATRFIFSVTKFTTSEMFVNLLIGSMYLVAPVFFMVVLSWAGLQAGAVFGAIFNPMASPAAAAGASAGGAAKGAASGAMGMSTSGGGSSSRAMSGAEQSMVSKIAAGKGSIRVMEDK